MEQIKCTPSPSHIFFARIRPDAVIPSKEEENAGYDLFPNFEEDFLIIPEHTTKLVPTGIACALHPKWYLQIEERSSTGSKGIKKSAGVIDSGYRGEILVAITNSNKKTLVIAKHPENKDYYATIPDNLKENGVLIHDYKKAIAQLILHEVPKMNIKEIPYDILKDIPSRRQDKGFGSSDTTKEV